MPSTCTVKIITNDLIKQASKMLLLLCVNIANYNILVISMIVNKVINVHLSPLILCIGGITKFEHSRLSKFKCIH